MSDVHTLRHSAAIKQEVANGHVPIKGHDSQDADPYMDQGNNTEPCKLYKQFPW